MAKPTGNLRSKVNSVVDRQFKLYSKIVYIEVIKNFNNEVEADGKTKWKRLRKATKKDRRRKGYDTSSKLQKNGTLKKSIKVFYDGIKIRIKSDLVYAETHQNGMINPTPGAKDIPARPFLDFPHSCNRNGKPYKKHLIKPLAKAVKKIIKDLA